MKHVIACGGALIMVIVVARGASRGPSTSDAILRDSCGLNDDGAPFDVSRRDDGVYAVRGDRVARAPLTTLERTVRTGEGVDSLTGRRWVRVRLDEHDAEVMEAFEREPTERKRIAVVVGGELASLHKVHETIDSTELEMSCCNPHACERWDHFSRVATKKSNPPVPSRPDDR